MRINKTQLKVFGIPLIIAIPISVAGYCYHESSILDIMIVGMALYLMVAMGMAILFGKEAS